MNKLTNTLLAVLVVILTIALVAYPSKSRAEAYTILGGLSHHFITEDYDNSNHNVVAFSYEKILAGYFKNSYNNDSFILGYEFEIDNEQYFDVILYVAAVRGYDKCYGKFTQEERQAGKSKVEVCGMIAPAFVFKVPYEVKPQLTLFGDAATLSARYDF